MEPILSVYCNERRNKVTRHVYPMELSEHNLFTFWNKAKQFKVLFNQQIQDNFVDFLNLFVGQVDQTLVPKGLFWVIDDFVGLFYITDISNVECTAHFTFFDRVLNGRVQLTKHMLAYLFNTFGFRRISVEIPLYASNHPRRFVKLLGFRYEGRKKSYAYFDDKWFDVDMYGIVPENLVIHSADQKVYEPWRVDNDSTFDHILCPNCSKYYVPKDERKPFETPIDLGGL